MKCLDTFGIPYSCPIIWEGGDPFEYKTRREFPSYTIYAKLTNKVRYPFKYIYLTNSVEGKPQCKKNKRDKEGQFFLPVCQNFHVHFYFHFPLFSLTFNFTFIKYDSSFHPRYKTEWKWGQVEIPARTRDEERWRCQQWPAFRRTPVDFCSAMHFLDVAASL